MKKRWILLGIAIVAVLALTAGIAFAAGRGSGSGTSPVATQQMVAGMDAMHDSPAMQKVHAQMPAALRAQCEAMHGQMDQMMSGPGSMMSGSGMTGGAGSEMTDGSMASHHSTSAAGR